MRIRKVHFRSYRNSCCDVEFIAHLMHIYWLHIHALSRLVSVRRSQIQIAVLVASICGAISAAAVSEARATASPVTTEIAHLAATCRSYDANWANGGAGWHPTVSFYSVRTSGGATCRHALTLFRATAMYIRRWAQRHGPCSGTKVCVIGGYRCYGIGGGRTHCVRGRAVVGFNEVQRPAD